MRCSATVSEQKAGEQGQAAGGQAASGGGGNGALAGAAAPAAQQMPQSPQIPVNATVCMEGEQEGRLSHQRTTLPLRRYAALRRRVAGSAPLLA